MTSPREKPWRFAVPQKPLPRSHHPTDASNIFDRDGRPNFRWYSVRGTVGRRFIPAEKKHLKKSKACKDFS